MKVVRVWMAWAAVAAMLLGTLACAPPEPEDAAESPRRTLEGKPDASLAGTWKTEDGKSTYTLRPDGTFDFVGKVTTQGGTFDNKFTAEWRVNGDQMLFSDSQKNVTPYAMKREGNRLTLTLTGSMKRQVVLTKQAE